MSADQSGPADARDPAGYRGARDALKAMLNSGPDGSLEWFQQFGTHGYALAIGPQHPRYLRDLNSSMRPLSVAFDPVMVRRWETMNELIVSAYDRSAPVSLRLRLEYTGLAALVGFPTLEELARRISRHWDEDGRLIHPLPTEFTLLRDGKPQKLKVGSRIVDLSHKLILMKSTLHPAFQAAIDSLDRRLSTSNIEGVEMPHVTLFERFEYFRNHWLHGRRFEGIEAWLLTLFIAMLYFRVPQSDEDKLMDEALRKFEAEHGPGVLMEPPMMEL